MGGEKRLVTTVIMELFFFLNLVGTEKEMERAEGEKRVLQCSVTTPQRT